MADAPSVDAAASLHGAVTTTVRIASIDMMHAGPHWFVRCRSTDGAEGIALANQYAPALHALVSERIAPCYVGRDARDLVALSGDAFRRSYKLAGLALSTSVAWVEWSVLDLLGRIAGLSAGALVRPVLRREVPVYMSSTRRDTTPEEEIAWVQRRLAQTGSRAVKMKVGGRMSANVDAAPGRTERLVALAEREFGGRAEVYFDANGSYDAPHAIEIGRMLEAHGVAMFEEPCPFEDLESTRRVADALELPVSGGEQDATPYRFEWMIRNRAVDVVQPDVLYCGGMFRALDIARAAADAGLPVTPHSPKTGPYCACVLQFLSIVPNIGSFHEYQAWPHENEGWYAPSFEVRGGVLRVPDAPGLGVTYDPAFLAGAERVSGASA